VEGPGVSEDEIRNLPDAQRAQVQDQYFQRLKALLADRFQLRLHRETRELPVYALIAAKNGPRIQAEANGAPKGPNSGTRVSRTATGETEITVSGIPLAMFVNLISNQISRTVLDKTGLKGDFDFKLTFAPDALQQPEGKGTDRSLSIGTDGPSIFTALQEQLGLKLDPQRGPVEVVVIDEALKASAN
jgi:uncharacterized protein (TIGR03435 family)